MTERKTEAVAKNTEARLADAYEAGEKRARELGPVHFASEVEEATKAGFPPEHQLHWAFCNGFAYGRRPR